MTATVQIIGPHLRAPGGVANLYNVLLPRLETAGSIRTAYLAVGSGGRGRVPWHVLSDQRRVSAQLAAGDADIVHLNPSLGYKSFVRDALIARAAKKHGRKLLVAFHGWSERLAREIDGPLRPVFAASFGKADAFIVLARRFEQRLRAWGVRQPIHRGVTAVDDDCIDVAAVERRLRALAGSSPAQPLALLFMSRLEHSKGALTTVQAVDALLQRGHALRLTVAGDGPAAGAIREYLRQRPGLGKHIAMAGQVGGEAKTELLRSHHLFCLPTSYGEGLPTAVVEAMAFGMTVVTSPVGGIADFFQAGTMGELVPGTEVPPLIAALQRLDEDRGRLAAMGRYNVDYARRHFYASRVASQLLEIYEAVLSPPAAEWAPTATGR